MPHFCILARAPAAAVCDLGAADEQSFSFSVHHRDNVSLIVTNFAKSVSF